MLFFFIICIVEPKIMIMRDTFPLKVIINSINNIYFEIKQRKRKAVYNMKSDK